MHMRSENQDRTDDLHARWIDQAALPPRHHIILVEGLDSRSNTTCRALWRGCLCPRAARGLAR